MLVLVTISVVAGSVGAVQRISSLGERAGDNAARDWAEREFGGGNALGANKEGLYAARALIPRAATYHLVVGEDVPGATELTAVGLPDFVRHFLMPRRPVQSGGDWTICYGCDPAALAGYLSVWDGGDRVSVWRSASS